MVKKEVASNKVLDDGGLTGWSLGLIALIFSLIFPIAGFIMGVVGLIVNRKERRYAKNMFTKTGKTLNIVALVVSVILFIASLVAVTYLESALSQIGGI